jgi:hypothetical protein
MTAVESLSSGEVSYVVAAIRGLRVHRRYDHR